MISTERNVDRPALSGQAMSDRESSENAQRLLAIVGHELRGPMAAISVAAASLSARESMSERDARSVAVIRRGTQHMARIVQQLQDFARVRGEYCLEREPTDLVELVHDQVAELRLSHPNPEVLIKSIGSPRGYWDRTRLCEVVSNLVGNAFQYGEAGAPITIGIDGESDPVMLSVHNKGVPIPDESLPTLFDPFRRARSADTRNGKERNLGLGLYIVKEIVAAHGGTVRASSTLLAGTTFAVQLPRR